MCVGWNVIELEFFTHFDMWRPILFLIRTFTMMCSDLIAARILGIFPWVTNVSFWQDWKIAAKHLPPCFSSLHGVWYISAWCMVYLCMVYDTIHTASRVIVSQVLFWDTCCTVSPLSKLRFQNLLWGSALTFFFLGFLSFPLLTLYSAGSFLAILLLLLHIYKFYLFKVHWKSHSFLDTSFLASLVLFESWNLQRFYLPLFWTLMEHKIHYKWVICDYLCFL